jgi:hypothetical protein
MTVVSHQDCLCIVYHKNVALLHRICKANEFDSGWGVSVGLVRVFWGRGGGYIDQLLCPRALHVFLCAENKAPEDVRYSFVVMSHTTSPGCPVAEGVSYRPFTPEARVRPRAGCVGYVVDRVASVQVFLQVLRLYPAIITPPILLTRTSILLMFCPCVQL